MCKWLLSGLGAGLAWIATQQRPQNNTFSGIGSAALLILIYRFIFKVSASHFLDVTLFPRSPKTNVTIEDINNNTPTVTVVNTQRVSATNTNSDRDTNIVTASNSNLITNTNRFGRGLGNTIFNTEADTCTSTFTVTNYRGVKRKKFSILI